MYPALAAVANLRAEFVSSSSVMHDDLTLQWVGTARGMEAGLVREADIDLKIVQADGIVGKGLGARVAGGIRLVWGCLQSLMIVRRFYPDIVFVTGGYSAIPVAIASWLLRVPIAVYLPDIEPGLAVRLVSLLSSRVLVTSSESQRFFSSQKVRVTGYPVRTEIMEAADANLETALQHFGLDLGRPTILVVGGSRGARSINRAIIDIVPEIVIEIGAQIIHVTGELDWHVMQRSRARLPEDAQAHYHLHCYLTDDMGLALRAADLVVSRSGASILGEYPVFGIPAILVPYPYARNHQLVNAKTLASAGAAVLIRDKNIKTHLARYIRDLLSDEEVLSTMQSQARSFAVLDASDRLASELINLAEANGN